MVEQQNNAPKIIEYTSQSSEETLAFGANFAKKLAKKDVVIFSGNLGSGKTTLIRGICRGLGVEQVVTSPTFTLVNEYDGPLPIFHFDFYRLGHETELLDLGLEEYLYGDGICLIEWPDIAKNELPPSHWKVELFWEFKPEWEFRRQIRIERIV